MFRKKILVSIIISIWWIYPFISFWQTTNVEPECTTCWNTPENIELINNFTTEILGAIRTIWTKGIYAGKHVPPRWFDSWEFNPPKQDIVTKSIRRARESLSSMLAIGRIYLEFDDVADVTNTLAILRKNETYLRDRKKLNTIEKDINKKKYELSVGGGRTDKISWETMKKMQTIVEKYKWLGILDWSTTIEVGSEYWDLIMLLWKTNSRLKTLLSWTTTDKDNSRFKLRTRGKIWIKISDEAIQQIKDEYVCATKKNCDSRKAFISEELKKIKDWFGNWLSNARNEIKSANTRLSNAWNTFSTTMTKRAKEIQEKTRATFNQISGSLDEIKNRRKTTAVGQQITETTKILSGLNAKTSSELQLEQQIQIWNDKENIKELFNQKMSYAEQKIYTEGQKMYNNYRNVDTPTDALMYIVTLSESINWINSEIIGNKDRDNCLIKNLWVLCEKQCSNIKNKECYYQ